VSGVTVLKLGGSVLTGRGGYVTAAGWLHERLASGSSQDVRFVVVVSAEYGHTDSLYREAQELAAEPTSDLLDLLWSTGETRSVALLALRLREIGGNATGISVHETGLCVCDETERITFNPLSIRAALNAHRVVVVPGFLATRANRVVTLGRGGSDWSAVLLAASLGADRCELVKDVDGYFTADPNRDTAAELIPQLSYAAALRMAEDGCPLVQRQAIAEAARARLPLIIRSLASQGTIVSTINEDKAQEQ
jgi:aspartate kinase